MGVARLGVVMGVARLGVVRSCACFEVVCLAVEINK